MISFDADLAGIKHVIDLLDGTQIPDQVERAVEESSALILNRIRTRFLKQVDPQEQPWIPSAASFRRAKQGRGGGTLFDTGRLFHSIQLYKTAPFEIHIGTDVPYGPNHQYGTIKLPQREFLGFSPKDRDLALNVFLKRIEGAFK